MGDNIFQTDGVEREADATDEEEDISAVDEIVMYAYLIEIEKWSKCDVTGLSLESADVLIKFDVFMSGMKGPSRA